VERKKQIYDEVEKTLRAMDHLPRLEANPFLYTRIQARLASEAATQSNLAFIRTKFKPAILALLVLLNVLTAVHFFKADDPKHDADQLISALSSDYSTTQVEF
jgi:hypothetical protein